MRLVPLALALALALPLVAANEAPVARASASTTDAVLFQPVTFTDQSVDPDGVIVQSVWTDDDGRDHVGGTWTEAFSWPGLHTTRLTVTDDAGASSFTDITVLVRAPLMQGRAVGLAQGNATMADTGAVSTEQDGTTDASLGDARDGDLRVAGLASEFRAVQTRAVATASVDETDISTQFGTFHVSSIATETLATCDAGTTRTASFGSLRFNDAPLVPVGDVAPGTVVSAGGVTLVLNVQEPGAAPDTLRVVGLRVLAPGETPIDVASAEAGVSHCPWSG